MVAISTHILDTSRGLPADQVSVQLYAQAGDEWKLISEGSTNTDGRFSSGEVTPPDSRIFKYRFEVEDHFQKANINVQSFYPFIEIIFRVAPGEAKYHVPLLLNPYGYSTYRGS